MGRFAPLWGRTLSNTGCAPRVIALRMRAFVRRIGVCACLGSQLGGCTSPPSDEGEATGEESGETGEELTPEEAWCPGDWEATQLRVDALIADLSVEAKIDLMAGSTVTAIDGLWPTPGVPGADLPGMRMVDGPRGVSGGAGPATAFPVGSARGASWDRDLERRVGEAMGVETRAYGASVLLAPTVNVLRHPRWGRAQETYGEEPFHVAQMGAAFVEGAQTQVMASVKHFAANSIEDTRFTVDVQVDERTLREVYLEPFETIVKDAGVASVMTAYNLVNGAYCAENEALVRDILKDEWGFLGFVESDWVFGTRSSLPSLRAGLDIEMPNANHYGAPLLAAAADGTLDEALIDDAVRRIAQTQWCWGMDTDPPVVDPSAVESAAHLDLAREVAVASMTLLRNESVGDAPALPIDRAGTSRIVVLGDLADAENIGDTGSSAVAPSEVVTALQGLTAAAQGVEIEFIAGLDPLDATQLAAVQDADLAIVVTGLDAEDEGEGFIGAGDRTSMSLAAAQVARIEEVAAANPRTVVVLEGGSAIVVDPWFAEVEAILMAWYPGSRGGEALAAVLFGDADPGGRSPVSWPRDEAQLPTFDNESEQVSYDAWHGYRHLDREGATPRYAFGHGLSYARFELRGASAQWSEDKDAIELDFEVENVGARAGKAVPQLYVGAPSGGLERPLRELEGFAALHLDPGQSETLHFEVDARQLSQWSGAWELVAGDYQLWLGWSAEQLEAPLVVAVP